MKQLTVTLNIPLSGDIDTEPSREEIVEALDDALEAHFGIRFLSASACWTEGESIAELVDA